MSESSQSNDLRNRILFTIFILSVYRFGTFVPLPGIDPEQLQIMMQGNQKGLLGMFKFSIVKFGAEMSHSRGLTDISFAVSQYSSVSIEG